MKRFTKTKRNLVLVLMCALIVGIAVCPASADNGGIVKNKHVSNNKYDYMQISKDYQSVAVSDNIEMFADMSTGVFCLRNNDNGYVWYSTPNDTEFDSFSTGAEKRYSQSNLLVGFAFKSDEIVASNIYYLDSNSAAESVVTQTDNGIHIDYSLDFISDEGDDSEEKNEVADTTAEVKNDNDNLNASAQVPVDFYLEDGHLVAKVDVENVKASDNIKIAQYNLLPYFGAANWTDSGYMFVPDGSGALINFDGHESNIKPYSEYVYGDDIALSEETNKVTKETVRMPVFGIKNGDNALFGIITEGEQSCVINAIPHSNSRGYNAINAIMNTKVYSKAILFDKQVQLYRLSAEAKDIKSFEVKYYVLSGERANYIGMAEEYRNYLISNNKLSKSVVKPTLNVDVYNAIDVTANFLGFNYSKLMSLTSYNQVTDITTALKKKGIDNISLRLKGWSNNGVTNDSIIKKVKYPGVLGSKSDFEEMTNSLKKQNIDFYPDVDLLSYMSGSPKKGIRNPFGKTVYRYQYMRSVYAFKLKGIKSYLLRPDLINEYADDFLDSYEDTGLKGLSLSSLTSMVYSNLKLDESVFRSKFPSIASEVFERVNKSGINLVGESCNAYTLPYVSKIYKAPVYSSNYTIFDDEVPFYEMVLHGYLNMTGDSIVQSGDSDTNYLKCVESGIELMWNGIYEDSVKLSDTNYDDLFGSTYTMWMDNAYEKYTKYQPLLEKIYDKTIVNHESVTDKVTLTEYDNGIKVYVNYSDTDYQVGGITVPAGDFNYKEG